MRKKEITPLILTKISVNRNNSRVKRPASLKLLVFLSLLLILSFVLVFLFSDRLSVNQSTIIGVAGATFVSIIVLVITLNSEKRKNYYTAQKAARVLSEVLNSVYVQIERVEKGTVFPICYPNNWLEYYEDCALYLEYDYLDTLLQVFEIISNINTGIKSDDESSVQCLIAKWNYLITDSTSDFCILSVMSNLDWFSKGWPEQKPWKEQRDYIAFNKYLSEVYSDTIMSLSRLFLVKTDGHAPVEKVEYFVMEELRKNSDLCEGKYKYIVVENKKMLYAIFCIFLSLKETDPLSLCWGTLSIQDKYKGEKK